MTLLESGALVTTNRETSKTTPGTISMYEVLNINTWLVPQVSGNTWNRAFPQ